MLDLLAAYYGQRMRGAYKEVAYLRSTGTQWLDTGVPLAEGLRISGRFRCQGTGVSIIDGRAYISLSPSMANSLFLLVGSSGKTCFGFFGRSGSGVNMVVDITYGQWVDFALERGRLTVNGRTATRKEPAFTEGYSANLYMFAGNFYGNPTPGDHASNLHPDSGFKIDIASMVIEADGTPVRRFVSCVRRRDNKPGMYDLCGSISASTGTSFYFNQGDGEFATGDTP